jgi:hypothetical protein
MLKRTRALQGSGPESVAGEPATKSKHVVLGRKAIELLPHQVDHARRVTEALQTFGVAFDTSDTGTGKTYVACKAAQDLAACSQIIVVCPNIVQSKWTTLLRASWHRGQHTRQSWMVFPYSLLTRSATSNGYFTFSNHHHHHPSVLSINGNGKLVERDGVDELQCSLRPSTALSRMLLAERTLLVLDETHRVKNGATQVAKAIETLIGHVRQASRGWVLHVSATPFDQVFQLPQYLSFMGAHLPERARALRSMVAAACPCEPAALSWSAAATMGSVLNVDHYRSMDEALEVLGSSGSDVGRRWKAVRAFMQRLRSFLPLEPTTSYLIDMKLFDPKGVHGSAADRLTAYLRSLPSWEAESTVLDCILWPFAIRNLGADIELARELVTRVLPRLMFRMAAPDYGFLRYDVDLFLDEVDVSETVAELVYLPDYKSLNTAAASPPAPLVSPDGVQCVDESAALQWDSPEWRLGQARPVEAWRKVFAESGDSSAKAMYDLCLCAQRLGAKADPKLGDDEPEPGSPHIRLECLKVPSLYALVRHVLASDVGSKVVIMFNHLHPLHMFERLLVADTFDPVCVTGAMSVCRRVQAIETWATAKRVLLCTIAVMNEGIDLHDTRGDEHRYTFIMACPSAIMTAQAKGRIHRAGVRSHAVNCVVFGGHALGGKVEQQLLMRLGTKNATLGSRTDATHVLTSVAEFKDLVRDVHGARAAPWSAVAGKSRTPDPHFSSTFPDGWWKTELALRTWRDVKQLRDWPEGYEARSWKHAWNRIVYGDDEYTDLMHHVLTQMQIDRAGLRLSDVAMLQHVWWRLWPFMQVTSHGCVLRDECQLRGATYATFRPVM